MEELATFTKNMLLVLGVFTRMFSVKAFRGSTSTEEDSLRANSILNQHHLLSLHVGAYRQTSTLIYLDMPLSADDIGQLNRQKRVVERIWTHTQAILYCYTVIAHSKVITKQQWN